MNLTISVFLEVNNAFGPLVGTLFGTSSFVYGFGQLNVTGNVYVDASKKYRLKFNALQTTGIPASLGFTSMHVPNTFYFNSNTSSTALSLLFDSFLGMINDTLL